MKTIEGWIIKYNQPSQALKLPSGRKVVEVILTDAFRESVDAINAGAATIEANIEHVDDAICRLGLSGKNVKVENRAEGVFATINLLDDTISADLFTRVQAGIVRGLSVEFDPSPLNAEPAYSLTGSGDYVRQWSKLTLRGFAITVDPAYPDAQITAATEGSATFARSLAAADLAKIADDITRIESEAAGKQRQVYEYEAFLLGVRP